MASNKSKYIDEDNVGIWLSALGFSFPRNQAEEKIFDKVYSNYEHKLRDVKIDAQRIIDEIEKEETPIRQIEKPEWKMAARNFGDLPQSVLDKMKKNQDDKKRGSQED